MSRDIEMGLRVESIDYAIDGEPILESLSFEVRSGSSAAIVGPSGAGKSTLLRIIAGILRPDRGRIQVDGLDVTSLATHERRIGMVFQDDQLFAHLSVADNVAFGLDMATPLRIRWTPWSRKAKRRRADRNARVEDMLRLVGLSGFESRQTTTLSGGEAKRVALARALAASPSVLLLDEPLTGLDKDLHDRLIQDLKDILESTRTTAVIVTHDLGEAEFLADTIVRLPKLGARESPASPSG